MPKPGGVSSKNTKAEILDAYQSLLEKLELGETPKDEKKAFDNVQGDVGKLQNSIEGKVSELSNLLLSSSRQVISQIQNAHELLHRMIKVRKEIEASAEAEKERIEHKRAQEQEDYEFSFERRKKRHEQLLADMKEKIEKDLREKQEVFQQKREEYKTLKAQSATFEARMKKAVDDAVADNTKQLALKHEQELAFQKQKFSGENQLLSQKIKSLEQSISDKIHEVKRLQGAAMSANTQLTRIAERAVDKRSTAPASVQSSQKSSPQP